MKRRPRRGGTLRRVLTGCDPVPAKTEYHDCRGVSNQHFPFCNYLPGGGALTDYCTSCERMATAETKITNLEGDMKEMGKKLDRLQWWIMSTAVGVAVTLVVNLVKGA